MHSCEGALDHTIDDLLDRGGMFRHARSVVKLDGAGLIQDLRRRRSTIRLLRRGVERFAVEVHELVDERVIPVCVLGGGRAVVLLTEVVVEGRLTVHAEECKQRIAELEEISELEHAPDGIAVYAPANVEQVGVAQEAVHTASLQAALGLRPVESVAIKDVEAGDGLDVGDREGDERATHDVMPGRPDVLLVDGVDFVCGHGRTIRGGVQDVEYSRYGEAVVCVECDNVLECTLDRYREIWSGAHRLTVGRLLV